MEQSGFDRTGYRSPRERIRYFPMKNMEPSEWIPPFACCALDNGFFGRPSIQPWRQIAIEQSAVWRVHKPIANDVILQNPHHFIFNGPTPIPPLGMGNGTFDFPCQALTIAVNDFPVGEQPCGPVAGSWALSSTGNAFWSHSPDIATQTAAVRSGQQVGGGYSVSWVSPNTNRKAPPFLRFNFSGAGVTPGFFPFGTDSDAPAATDVATSGLSWSRIVPIRLATGGYGIVPLHGGLYLISGSATLSLEEDTPGTILGIEVLDPDDATLCGAHRLAFQERDRDTYYRDAYSDFYETPYDSEPFVTAENVAFSHLVSLSGVSSGVTQGDPDEATFFDGNLSPSNTALASKMLSVRLLGAVGMDVARGHFSIHFIS